MDKDTRLISILRNDSADSQAIKIADFYRNEKQIKEAIEAGWKLINIWKYLKTRNEFSGGYDSFRRYAKKLSSQTSAPDVISIKQKVRHSKETNRLALELAEKTLDSQSPESQIGQKTLGFFLGKQDEIREAIDAGYRLKTIWKALIKMKSFDASYNCFTCYVRKYITGEDIDLENLQKALIQEKSGTKSNVRNVEKSSPERNSNTFSERSNKQHTEKKSSGFDHFHYDPTSIDKDSLI